MHVQPSKFQVSTAHTSNIMIVTPLHILLLWRVQWHWFEAHISEQLKRSSRDVLSIQLKWGGSRKPRVQSGMIERLETSEVLNDLIELTAVSGYLYTKHNPSSCSATYSAHPCAESNLRSYVYQRSRMAWWPAFPILLHQLLSIFLH